MPATGAIPTNPMRMVLTFDKIVIVEAWRLGCIVRSRCGDGLEAVHGVPGDEGLREVGVQVIGNEFRGDVTTTTCVAV